MPASSLCPRRFAAAANSALLCLLTALLSSCATETNAPVSSVAARSAAVAKSDPLQSLDYASSQQPVVDLDHDIALAGNDPAKLAPIADRLFTLLRARATTFAARQAICQRLAGFPAAMLTTDEARTLFSAMLADDTEINLARLALESVRSERIDALFLHALEHSTPVTRVALVQSAGNRHLAAAVPVLTSLLRDSNPSVVSAAIRALSQIATPPALAALNKAPDPSAPAVIEARLAIARSRPADEAVSVYDDIIGLSGIPANLRAAAFRGLLDARADEAPARFVVALSGHDPVLKAVVIEAIAGHPAKNLTRVLASELSAFDAPTQTAVIAALGRRGDPQANNAIVAALASSDPGVRAAALRALGELPGTSRTAAALANAITHGDADDARLARRSLSRLNGPDVAAAVVAGASSGASALRATYLEAIGDRYMIEDVPFLLKTRSDSDAAVRIAALAALAALAPPADESQILDWALAATDSAEQSRALRTVVSVALRNRDLDARAQPVVAAIDRAAPATSLQLIPALRRLGGKTAVACVARLATDNDPDISNAAILALTHWPDADGLEPLISAAKDAPTPVIRAGALEAATRFLERDRSIHSPALTGDLARLLATAPAASVRLRLVRLLGRCSDEAALKLAGQQSGHPELATAAGEATLAIRSNLAGPPVVTGSREWGADNLLDGNTATSWSVPASAGEWFRIDFHSSRSFHRLVLDESNHDDDFPVRYAVFATDNPDDPGTPCATGPGQPGRTVIDLPAGTHGRYLLVRHVGERDGTAWTVAEVLID